MAETKLDESDLCNPLKKDRVYWKESDALDYKNEFISDDEALLKNRDIVNHERILGAPHEFRQFLLLFDVPVFFPKDGRHKTSSNKICSTLKGFSDLVENRFESYRGSPLYLETDTFRDAMGNFFNLTAPAQYIKNFLFDLFGSIACKEVFDKYPDNDSYIERGEVFDHLKETYDLSRNTLRTILPALKGLKNSPPSTSL